MPLYAFGDAVPTIDATAYVHPDAVIIGNVIVGPEASIWPCAVLRGDDGTIRIGARTSVQDGSVLHCTAELDTVVGAEVVIGHMVHLEGCIVEDRALVGNGAVVLHRGGDLHRLARRLQCGGSRRHRRSSGRDGLGGAGEDA